MGPSESKAPELVKEKGKEMEAGSAQEALAPDAEKALEKVFEEGGPRALLSAVTAFSRSTTIGPDPQTARILSEVEIHSEKCRLEGFQASLRQKNEQGVRDHEFRMKRLTHETLLSAGALVVAVVFGGVGLWLYSTGHQQLGGYVLFASFFLIQSLLGGKIPGSRGTPPPGGPPN